MFLFCVTAALSPPHRLSLEHEADRWPAVNERGDILLRDKEAPYTLRLYRQQQDGFTEVWSKRPPGDERYYNKAISLQSVFVQEEEDADTIQLNIDNPQQQLTTLHHRGILIGCTGECPVYTRKDDRRYIISIQRDEGELLLRPSQGATWSYVDMSICRTNKYFMVTSSSDRSLDIFTDRGKYYCHCN